MMSRLRVQADHPALDPGDSPIDPLATTAGCTRDIPHLLSLRTNLISVYSVDPTQDHSVCMGLLADAGIYVLLDLANSSNAINRADPAWNVNLFSHYQSVVDEFASYNNILGFIVGNEVANNASNSYADAFVKGAVRDVKSYIKSKNYRAVPVGYGADDAADIRYEVANYFDCGDADTAIDVGASSAVDTKFILTVPVLRSQQLRVVRRFCNLPVLWLRCPNRRVF
jgi:hypothetical protein